VLNHVLDLPFHRYHEQHEEIHEQNGPEDWDIENWEDCHQQRRPTGFGAVVPKLELR
jgi:hypothetical protein